jgi:hypothetical protein
VKLCTRDSASIVARAIRRTLKRRFADCALEKRFGKENNPDSKQQIPGRER